MTGRTAHRIAIGWGATRLGVWELGPDNQTTAILAMAEGMDATFDTSAVR